MIRKLIIGGSLAISAMASYGLAIAGEPQSLWLWRDILGLL